MPAPRNALPGVLRAARVLQDKQHWVSSGRCMQALHLAPEGCPGCAAALGCRHWKCSDWKRSSCIKQAVGSSTGRDLELQALPRQPLQSLCRLGRQIPHFKYSGCLSECQVPSQHSSEASGTPQSCSLACSEALGAFPVAAEAAALPRHRAREPDVNQQRSPAGFQLWSLLLLIKLSRQRRQSRSQVAKGPAHRGLGEPWYAAGRPWARRRAGAAPACH